MNVKNKILLMTLFLGLTANVSADSVVTSGASELMKSYDFDGDERCPSDDCFDTALKVEAICAKRVKSKWIDACNLNAKQICAESIKAKKACLDYLVVNENACIKKLQSQDICAQSITAANFCSSGPVKFTQAEICQQFRATVVFGSNQPYNLNTPLNFDTILDDPNNNVTLAPFAYHTPVAGYYLLSIEIDQNSLVALPTSPILGPPVANIIVNVNGNLVRQTFIPYLTFHNDQVSTFSSLIRLKAGDVVTVTYEIIVLTDAGLVAYPSSVTVLGNGTDAGDSSLFQIHYMSSNCVQPICAPCLPVCEFPCDVECPPCKPDCAPKPCPELCKPEEGPRQAVVKPAFKPTAKPAK